MAFNGSGVFNLVSGNPVVTGTTISSTWANNTLSDVATGLSNCVTRDGQSPATANLPMGGYKLTGLALATATGDALSYGRAATVTDFTSSGTITFSGGTANGVAYLNASKQVTTGSALTFDGTNLGLGTTSPFSGAGQSSLSINGSTASRVDLFANNVRQAYFYSDSTICQIGSYAAIPLAFNYGNSEQMRLTSTGLGIGTSSPSQKLHVYGATTGIGLFESGTTSNAQVRTKTTLGEWATGTGVGASANAWMVYDIAAGAERLRVDSSGNLGLGVTPSASTTTTLQLPTFAFSKADNVYGGKILGNAYYQSSVPKYIASSYALAYEQAVGSGAHAWYTAPSGTAGTAISFTQAMTLDASGNLLVGTTTINNKGTVTAYSNSGQPSLRAVGGSSMPDGSIAMMVDKYSTTNTTSQWFLGFTINNQATASGVITANGASQAAFGSWSDRRLKVNIVDLPPQLSNILALRPVEFDYIQDEGGGHQISFIAQEFEEVYPDAIGERADGMKTLTGWGKTEARLVKAIQEQQAIIESLTARITTLEAK